MALPSDEPDVRTRLRECALDLFGRNSIRDTPTRSILTAAGLRNPSAISYHFGSKRELVEDLVDELVHEMPVMRRQIELVEGSDPPTIDAWVAVVADSAVALLSTERGCLQARLWSEYVTSMKPHIVEDFLIRNNPLANAWSRAAVETLPHLHGYLAIARNIAMYRLVEFMVARRAERILHGDVVLVADIGSFRQMMFEMAIGILREPSTLTDSDITPR